MIYIAQEIPIVIILHYNDRYTIIIIIISTFIPILTIIYYTVVLFIISARVTITVYLARWTSLKRSAARLAKVITMDMKILGW
jgi:hypothetical protein